MAIATTCLGLTSIPAAELSPEYCNVSLCSSGDKSPSIKQLLGFESGKLGWWDCRIQGKCRDLSEEIHKLKLDLGDCSNETITSYQNKVIELNTKLIDLSRKFGEKGEEAVGSHMKDGLIAELKAHLKKCYTAGLFIPNPEKCVTVACKEIVGTIDRLGVNQRDCKVELEALYPSKNVTWDFDFEHTLVEKKLNEFKEKCIDANFLPAMTAFNIPIMKKDMPLAEQCLSEGGKINYQLGALEVVSKDCSSTLYHSLLEKVADFDDSLERLGEVTDKEFCTVLHDRFKKDLENKVAMHFLRCEEQGLFPEDKLQCISRQCKEDEEKIASFKVTKEECENHPRNFVLHTQFSYENLLIQDKLKEYQQKCIDENKLPYKQIGATWVTKSEYETRYKELESTIAAMGQDEDESTWPELNIKIIPFLKLQSEIKGFKVDKEHCASARFLAPLKANIDQYILLWRNSGFEVPQSMNELEDLVTQFARDCEAKHFD